ncbi:MAG: glycosyltransferase family 4 protein, partial [Proteobacteria bacterium]|nr:glycosyltransferase family 4 protein [Pseudomonadota bacterium]
MTCVRFLGSVESEKEVWSLMKASAVFATPSIREGFGLAALEALACGLPVVTADHRDNAIPEFVTPGVNGLVVTPDAAAFAKALETLLANEDLRSKMSRAAVVTARSHSLEKAVRKLERVFSSVSKHQITSV